MVEECGYGILDTIATPLPVRLVLPLTLSPTFAPLHELHYLLVRGRRTLLAYQCGTALVTVRGTLMQKYRNIGLSGLAER